jgi:hypothetical protein
MLNEPQLLIPVAAPPRWLHLRRSARSRLVLGGSLAPLVAAGLAWQWSWLVAIGVAPLLLSVAPCIVMCALALCMTRMGGRSCDAARPTGPLDRAPSLVTFATKDEGQ